ncbi:type II toxin-antitoxin system CcdA family antitoxin [Arcobacter arenosus]|jgi:antitoxin CcdA|uniref:type II toxin-antitoxin system CcdA family antitoxin n=1 Tax=Arcobacter arenosus TaxID=2576037 RepID=UPI003BACD6D1
MTSIYDKSAKKKATNVSINSDLLEKAKEYKINISSSIEKTLEELVKKAEENKWEKENKEAIKEYNKRIKDNGLFSNGLRSF